MNGATLAAFCDEINGGVSIGDTPKAFNLARAFVEHRRPWMALRYTDSSKTITAGPPGSDAMTEAQKLARRRDGLDEVLRSDYPTGEGGTLI